MLSCLFSISHLPPSIHGCSLKHDDTKHFAMSAGYAADNSHDAPYPNGKATDGNAYFDILIGLQ